MKDYKDFPIKKVSQGKQIQTLLSLARFGPVQDFGASDLDPKKLSLALGS